MLLENNIYQPVKVVWYSLIDRKKQASFKKTSADTSRELTKIREACWVLGVSFASWQKVPQERKEKSQDQSNKDAQGNWTLCSKMQPYLKFESIFQGAFIAVPPGPELHMGCFSALMGVCSTTRQRPSGPRDSEFSASHMAPTWKGTGQGTAELLLSNPVLKSYVFLLRSSNNKCCYAPV